LGKNKEFAIGMLHTRLHQCFVWCGQIWQNLVCM